MTVTRFRWENRSSMRYYQIIFQRDLFGDWVLTKVWGGINQSTGRASNIACSSYEDGLKKIESIKKTREKRGYCLLLKN